MSAASQPADARRALALADQLLAVCDPRRRSASEFLAAQFDAGLAWVHHPVGEGGLGLEPGLQPLVDQRLEAAGAPDAYESNPVAHGIVAPTLTAHGSPEQRQRYLRPMFTGEEIWSQLLSEPGAGSDLASLATRAVRDGDVWRVNGQKVWSTLAHAARFSVLLARTDPELPKHRGLTYFIVDMQSHGIEVRPLRQLTGDAEFNETYLNDVRIPDASRVGPVGGGWAVAMTNLMVEHANFPGAELPRGGGPIGQAIELWRRNGRDPVARDELVRLWIDAELNRLTALRARFAAHHGGPGAEGSVLKISIAEFYQRATAFCMRQLGAEGLLYADYAMRRPERIEQLHAIREPQRAFLRARAQTIEGGTVEVLRNNIGERVLGLPAEPRNDKDRPWSQVPRS